MSRGPYRRESVEPTVKDADHEEVYRLDAFAHGLALGDAIWRSVYGRGPSELPPIATTVRGRFKGKDRI